VNDLVIPIAAAVIDELRSDAIGANKDFAPLVWAELAGGLERWLSRLLHSALSTKLAIATTSAKPSAKIAVRRDIAACDLGIGRFFKFFPGAKETVDLVVKDWVTAQRLMLARLKQDRKRLAAMVPEIAHQRIKRITPGLSDPHDCGQTVTIVQFANGGRVVYKPRDCEGEKIWFSALLWLNGNGFEPSSHIPTLIGRGRYCWMSFVDHRECNSINAVERFYFRWGAQAAIAQLLGCADLHRQNWIASGEDPVLVDGEMVGDAFSPHAGQVDRHLHPLLRTGLLPFFESDGVGRYEGIAPFDSSGRKKEQNVFWPVYHGRTQTPDKYIEEIANGFEAAARFVCAPRNCKRFRPFILQAARRKHLRLLKRATAQYRQILDESLHPYYLRKRGDRFKYLFERCGKDRIEADCLIRCSVPRFTTRLNAKASPSVPAFGTMLESAQLLRSRLAPQSKGKRKTKRPQ